MVSEFDVIPTIIGILFLVIPAMLLGKLCSHFKTQTVFSLIHYYNNRDSFRPCYSNPIFKRENFSLIQKLS